MTIMATHPRRALEDLEVPEGFRPELINGELILSPSPKPLHWWIQLSLYDQFRPLGWTITLGQTVVHPEHDDQEPRPDLALLPAEAEIDPEGVFPAEEIQLAVEVLSRWNRGTDLVDKVEVYAGFDIPLYLIIDPFKGECLLHQHPSGAAYATKQVFKFGDPVPLPDPVGVTLDTSSFKRYSNQR